MDLAKEVLEKPDFDFDPLVKYGGVGSKINWKDGVRAIYCIVKYSIIRK